MKTVRRFSQESAFGTPSVLTIDAAQVIGLDAMVGSIAAGKMADFVVLDRDPEAGGGAGLRDAKVAAVTYGARFTAA